MFVLLYSKNIQDIFELVVLIIGLEEIKNPLSLGIDSDFVQLSGVNNFNSSCLIATLTLSFKRVFSLSRSLQLVSSLPLSVDCRSTADKFNTCAHLALNAVA